MELKLRNSTLYLAGLLREWKGEDTVVLRLAPSVSWASYCIICTCNSVTHMRGILNHLRNILYRDGDEKREESLLQVRSLPRQPLDGSWCPIDMGEVVLHLMSSDARAFYQLEELWPVAEVLGQK